MSRWVGVKAVVVAGVTGLLAAGATVLTFHTAHAAPIRYEAEEPPATCDGTIDSDHSGFSGTGFCNTTNTTGAAAQFTVSASGPGTAMLGVQFANGSSSSRPADVVLNGTVVESTSFETTGAWPSWATKTLPVQVSSGSNTIRFEATGSGGLPNIDYLDFSVSGSTTPPTTPPTSEPPPPPPPVGQADGFASVNALGQDGTTGGEGGPTVVVDTTGELLEAIDTLGPLVILVAGTINITSKQGVRPDKTIRGVDDTAVINGGGLDFHGSSNVIIRNITFTNAEDDAVNVGQNSHHIWVDHNTFIDPVDGAVDIVREADYVTVSWNWFAGTDKTMLISHSDGASSDIGHLKVTIHHNYFDGSRQRHPRVRFGEPVHVYNNYFRANELYGVASTMDAGVLVEGNYFQSVPFPCFSASGFADSDPGRLVERNNVFDGSGTCETAGTVTEPGGFYGYQLDDPQTLPTTVPAGAGAGRL